MNRPIRLLAIFVTLGVLATLSAKPASANVILSYTASHYTDIFGGTNIPGDYDTSMFVSGTMELANPLGPGFNGTVNPLHYSFNDGRNTFTDIPLGLQLVVSTMTTDSSGIIIHWLFLVRGDEDQPTFHREVNFSDTTLFSTPYFSQGLIQLNNVPPGGFSLDSADSRNPGAWTVLPQAVAEPLSINLILVGLAGIGFRLWKRTS